MDGSEGVETDSVYHCVIYIHYSSAGRHLSCIKTTADITVPLVKNDFKNGG